MAQTRAAVPWDDRRERDARRDDPFVRAGEERTQALTASMSRATGGVPGRRTVTIRGQGAERYRTPASRRTTTRRHEREGFRPDRAALWAVLLGVMLILVAVASAHAATF